MNVNMTAFSVDMKDAEILFRPIRLARKYGETAAMMDDPMRERPAVLDSDPPEEIDVEGIEDEE